jgi:tRNA(Ile)-lysidine synthase
VPVKARDRLIGLIRAGLPSETTIGVALSGGGDSTALLHLALQAGFPVEAVTVDHRLRPESAEEGARVSAWCAALGVRHEVRVWAHGDISGNLMDAARQARVALIADWARARGIGVVALGHTRDDQAETVLMGLARAGGLAGLSGMRSGWEDGGVRFIRPLLDAGREELRDWLRGQGIGWIDDPTNDNDRFTRTRARRALVALAPLGITAERLADVARHLAEAQAALMVQVAAVAGRLVRQAAGALWFDAALWAEPVEVRRQIVQAAIVWLAGPEARPRAADLSRLMDAMAAGRDATLSGCRYRQGWLMREPRAVGGPVAAGALWDGRWQMVGCRGRGPRPGGRGAARLPGLAGDWVCRVRFCWSPRRSGWVTG